MRVKICFLCLFGLFFFGCREKFPYPVGTFPEDLPINIAELNSEFDEMNSDYIPPYLTLDLNFIYSSNAKNLGVDFDLEPRSLVFTWDKELGKFSYAASKNYPESQVTINRLLEVNSECNERGPYSFGGRLFFSQDCAGFAHIFGSSFRNTDSFNQVEADIYRLQLFEESVNEMYPSFFGHSYREVKGSRQVIAEKFLFSADIDGRFDIYEIALRSDLDPLEFLTSGMTKSINKLAINTPSNDHMPFVYGDLLVFSSDRPGGFGGYDLYYSLKTADGWEEPVNFGPKINSEFDEFRPVVSDAVDFSNRLMIFSSNRPGGMGGFDLYFVGIEKF
ncbi:PD40 domain-containing protein [Algoriphagus aestuariicola]|uniref:PD40 domain-containing protein n=1 Tax=Algoriphagus aestuariicola TaxID=1852016 RepID=A0ABS3BUP7_9BACT|nr:PD40 domain-containing protein [Algoriphagus aestuariicola]MBN7802790.1 PD40 domain-containing protein [Algoriphagus aestuariicola]